MLLKIGFAVIMCLAYFAFLYYVWKWGFDAGERQAREDIIRAAIKSKQNINIK